jgi:hypothetical protein
MTASLVDFLVDRVESHANPKSTPKHRPWILGIPKFELRVYSVNFF